jgi:hypothetical protein
MGGGEVFGRQRRFAIDWGWADHDWRIDLGGQICGADATTVGIVSEDNSHISSKSSKRAAAGGVGVHRPDVAPYRRDAIETIEDKSMLRERTKRLFHLLDETDSRSICLIGHKGYLRELERGPLGNADAELFENCEVRVYRLELVTGHASDIAVGIDDGKDGGFDGPVGRDITSRSFPVLRRAEKVASSVKSMQDTLS